MAHNFTCYRCGGSLAKLSLPFSRHDECPHCENYLHVCKMCRFFDASATRQCLEDDAEDVTEKERLNFCDYFSPSESAFDPVKKSAADRAANELDALFGSGSENGDSIETSDSDLSAAEKLFK